MSTYQMMMGQMLTIGNGNDLNDSQQHGSDSQGDSDNEPEIDDSCDDSEAGPNDRS